MDNSTKVHLLTLPETILFAYFKTFLVAIFNCRGSPKSVKTRFWRPTTLYYSWGTTVPAQT